MGRHNHLVVRIHLVQKFLVHIAVQVDLVMVPQLLQLAVAAVSMVEELQLLLLAVVLDMLMDAFPELLE